MTNEEFETKMREMINEYVDSPGRTVEEMEHAVGIAIATLAAKFDHDIILGAAEPSVGAEMLVAIYRLSRAVISLGSKVPIENLMGGYTPFGTFIRMEAGIRFIENFNAFCLVIEDSKNGHLVVTDKFSTKAMADNFFDKAADVHQSIIKACRMMGRAMTEIEDGLRDFNTWKDRVFMVPPRMVDNEILN